MDEAFLARLQAAFRIEAEEHLQALSAGLLDVERVLKSEGDGPDSGEIAALTETIFREAHSLKGASRAVSFSDIETICQALEDVFALWKSSAPPKNPAFDSLHAALDMMGAILAASSSPSSQPSFTQSQILEVVRQVQAVKNPPLETLEKSQHRNGAAPDVSTSSAPEAEREVEKKIEEPKAPPAEVLRPPAPVAPQASSTAAETIRIATAKLDTLLLQAEEMVTLKMTSQQRLLDLRELQTQLAAWRKEWGGDAEETSSLPAHPETIRLREQLHRQRGYLKTLQSKIAALTKSSEIERHAVDGLVNNLLEDTKQLLMQPFSTMLAIFPKLVRDVARELGKDIGFQIKGGEVEIDKRILEEMKAPLTHLLRNSIDHGLETPEVRAQNGKPARGHLSINIAQTGGKVEIEIEDDGAGIAVEKVKAAAVRNGVLAPEDAERMSDQDALQLIFKSAISTSPIVTELSGRGLGMAIVREKVENLGGDIALETKAGKGTTFRILLPLTMATFRGLLVKESEQNFLIPTLNIERVLRVRQNEIKSVEGRATILASGQVLGFVTLRDVLGMGGAAPAREAAFIHVVVLSAGGEMIAFGVEAVLDEQEVLLKSFEKPLLRVRNIAGATVLGSGKVAPVLNVADLLQSAVRGSGAQRTSTPLGPPVAAPEVKTIRKIMVADDSITSRMLIKNILEAAGYVVQTAVDGQDAITELRAGEFDLLVSDVDMPRLNGFGLTSQVRADAKLAQLPVVLVTGRETREDRERGIDVGASAYLVKSSFDQSNLLEIVGRLL